jgi:LPXTG-motif cell wall-anchored protein
MKNNIAQNIGTDKSSFWKIIGGILLVGGASFFIYRKIKKKKEIKLLQEEEKLKEEQVKKLEEETQGTESEDTKAGDLITPKRNVDKGITNKFSDIRGITLLPAKKSNNSVEGHQFALGFANIRETAEVNNERGILDLWKDNLLGKVSAGATIGKLVSEKFDGLEPPMRWFLVKLTKPLDGWTYGWVRSDAVTFKPFTKKSKFSSYLGEDMLVKYDNSYSLGGNVFPHTTPPY